MSPQLWTPPAADKQAWTPPAADRQVAPQSHGDRLKGTPTGMPDNFMGTLAKDFAALPEGVWNTVTHPIDTVKGAVRQLINLPGDVVTDISQGNWGKLAAKAAELAVPALSTERGAAVAGAAGGAVKDAVGAVGSKVAEVAANPVAREVIGIASPRLKNTLAAFNRVKTAAQAAAAEDAAAAVPAAAAVETPGMALARESGAEWAKLSPGDQAMLESVAKARANVAAQPVARTPMGPPAEVAPSAPLRPISPPEPPQAVPTPTEPAVPVQAPPPSMAQAEAAMARKNPAPIDPAETQTPFAATGERKSPQLVAAERTAANTAAKADRWAPVLHKFGITAEDLPNINDRQWGEVIGAMREHGLLPAGEKVPKSSIPAIAQRLKAMEKGTQQGPAVAISPGPRYQESPSFVVVDRATGKAVMETYEKKTAAAVNREKYDVIPAGEYLAKLNSRVATSAAPAAPDLSAIPLAKLQTMKFSDLQSLFPKGTPKAQISQAIAQAMEKTMKEGTK